MKSYDHTPIWQRIVSGLFALGVAWALVLDVADGGPVTWSRVVATLATLGGGYLFAHIAVSARLPSWLN